MGERPNAFSQAWYGTPPSDHSGRTLHLMLKVLFTSDYEIHGNGEGDPYALMLEPTERMLRLFEQYGAKLTIMADVAEILKFREYAQERGRDDYRYAEIAEQLREAVRRGHDVQLHLHSSYFNARHEAGRWVQDWSEYNFAGLALKRLREVISIGKEFLENLLKPVDPNYRCFAFRAANWSVSPSANVVRALVENGLLIDTSVFKYGRREGLVNFDYRHAFSPVAPWRVDEKDICAQANDGRLFEFPIYSESRRLGAFLTSQRIQRVLMSRAHKLGEGAPGSAGARRNRSWWRKCARLWQRHAWKADFNQCTGGQLARALKRAGAFGQSRNGEAIPFVLIGHSKLFTRSNERSLEPFLKHVAKQPERYRFGRFSDFGVCRPAALQAA